MLLWSVSEFLPWSGDNQRPTLQPQQLLAPLWQWQSQDVYSKTALACMERQHSVTLVGHGAITNIFCALNHLLWHRHWNISQSHKYNRARCARLLATRQQTTSSVKWSCSFARRLQRKKKRKMDQNPPAKKYKLNDTWCTRLNWSVFLSTRNRCYIDNSAGGHRVSKTGQAYNHTSHFTSAKHNTRDNQTYLL